MFFFNTKDFQGVLEENIHLLNDQRVINRFLPAQWEPTHLSAVGSLHLSSGVNLFNQMQKNSFKIKNNYYKSKKTEYPYDKATFVHSLPQIHVVSQIIVLKMMVSMLFK